MDISLIHAGLAGGAALAALPVILHLFMRQTPKHVIFPALRLIRERQKRSRKRLRIKNWLLLLARMALVALMALALTRPRLFSPPSLGDQEVPTPLGPPLDGAVRQGYAAVAESDRPRHEVYGPTDLARSGWDTGRPVEGLDRIKAIRSGVATYILRLTPKDARDIAVVAADPSENV